MSYCCLYVSASLTDATVIDDPRLERTSERHKIALDVPPVAPSPDPRAELDARPDLAGIVLEAGVGWATLRQLLLARAAIAHGRRVWMYWPAEQAVECLHGGRLASAWRLWAVCMIYLAGQRLKNLAGDFIRGPNSPLRKLLGGKSPGEWRLTIRARAVIAALRDRANPVRFSGVTVPSPTARIKGTGVYLRLDFWQKIESGGSYGHTCYVAKELAAVSERLECFVGGKRFSLLDDFGIPQHVLPPPAETAGENVIIDATYYHYRVLETRVRELRPAYIYERLTLGNYTGAILSQELGIPYIVEYNGSELTMRRTFDKSRYIHEDVYLRAEALAFEQATLISVVSAEIKAGLVARGISADKILVNPNGADLDAYAPAAPEEKRRLRRELGFGDADRVIGFSGTFGGWHGVDVLAAALPRICEAAPHAKFLLIGDGSYKALVDTAVRAHGLENRVISTGSVPQQEGARLLKACDIYVSPHSSHMVDSRFFGSPTKLFEYMAMQGGIVASDLEQIGQVLSPALRPADLAQAAVTVSSERGVLCTPGSVDEFAAATVFLVNRPDICEAIGRNARQAVADHFSWKRHVANLWRFAAAMSAPPAVTRRRRASFVGRFRLKRVLNQGPPEQPLPATPAPKEILPPLPKPPADIVLTGEAYKDEAQRQWNNDPVGSQYVKGVDLHTLEWYLEAERYRYREYAPWMPEVMEFDRHAGERVLEIGGGMGTDLAQFARHGAQVTDLDLSSGHLALARESFALRGLSGEFILRDAESLPFDDATFDLVYSNGVLHHTPNTSGAVQEVLRVLKPGGKAIVMMYAEESLHYWRNLVWTLGLKDGGLWQHSIGEIMSRHVERSDVASARPLVKVYSRTQLRHLFAGFEDIEILQRQMVPAEVPRLLVRVPVATLGKFMGWNLIIKARKPLTAIREGVPAETTPASARR